MPAPWRVNELIPTLARFQTRSAKRPPASAGSRRRTAPPEERRAQLIEATIRCVANRGLAETTIATVASEAGLSQGIINLHFQSKERLLTETLRYLADEYRTACADAAAHAAGDRRRRAAGDGRSGLPAQHLRPRQARRVVRVLGRAQVPPDLSAHLRRARQRRYDDMVRAMCAKLCEQGDYPDVEPALVADGLSALTDGLWLDLLVRPDSMSREQARRIAMSYLADAFPRHFPQPGPQSRGS